MTASAVEDWLHARTPARPDALARQMSHSVALCPEESLDEAPTMSSALGVLGLWQLAVVVREQTPSADLALKLLAADAFVTYAFEAAAEEGAGVAPFVAWLVREAA